MRQTQNGVDLFQNLRRIFEYPGYDDEFTRTMCKHLSKANNSPNTSSHSSSTETTNTQLTSGVVKLRI
jgi:hypothetical protein